MVNTIGGVCNHIDVNKYNNRLSFVKNYNRVAVIPFPHLNLINCVGMTQKTQYLIWREKNGFFTALDRQGKLLTWSLLNGKLLYNEDYEADNTLEQYEVYRSDDKDISYTQDFYNLNDHTLTLLKSKKSIQD